MKFGFSLRVMRIKIRDEQKKVNFAEFGGLNHESHSAFSAYVFLVLSPLASFRLLGGLKWTRTTDLTLIRRAL